MSDVTPRQPVITVDQFQRIDMRVGRVIDVQPFPEARKPAYKLQINFGLLGIKRSSAQITDLYTPETLRGRLIVAVVNVPPRQIGRFFSEVLVLGSTNEDEHIVLLTPDTDVAPGSPIS